MPPPRLFVVFAEAGSPDRAFAQAQQNPVMAGRVHYELLDTVVFPSDKHAYQRAEAIFGFQPQADKVYIAGADTNTVWAIKVIPRERGQVRFMFFGLHR